MPVSREGRQRGFGSGHLIITKTTTWWRGWVPRYDARRLSGSEPTEPSAGVGLRLGMCRFLQLRSWSIRNSTSLSLSCPTKAAEGGGFMAEISKFTASPALRRDSSQLPSTRHQRGRSPQPTRSRERFNSGGYGHCSGGRTRAPLLVRRRDWWRKANLCLKPRKNWPVASPSLPHRHSTARRLLFAENECQQQQKEYLGRGSPPNLTETQKPPLIFRFVSIPAS